MKKKLEENCNFPKNEKLQISSFFSYFFHFFIMFHHFCFQWCKNFPKNKKVQFSSSFFHFFIIFLSFFIIFYHFSSISPLEAKMIKKNEKKTRGKLQFSKKMKNCNFPRFFHFFFIVFHFFHFFLIFFHFCFIFFIFLHFSLIFSSFFHHFCFQWCKNFPKNEKLQFSLSFFHCFHFFIFF